MAPSARLRFPFEIVAIILELCNVDDCGLVHMLFSQFSVSSISRHRKDPRLCFRMLTPDVSALRRSMIELNVVLSGSRSSNWFYPGACSSDSDYDFYCQMASSDVFASRLCSLGADEQWTRDDGAYGLYGGEFSMRKGTMNGYNVQIISALAVSPFGSVLSFHSSIVQCIITGYCAVSLYHNVSSQNKSIPWSRNNSWNMPLHVDPSPCLNKYSSRGFQQIEYSQQLIGANDYLYNTKLHDLSVSMETSGNGRKLTDNGCLLIEFNDYPLDKLTQEDGLIQSIAQECMLYIRGLEWIEIQEGTEIATEFGHIRISDGINDVSECVVAGVVLDPATTKLKLHPTSMLYRMRRAYSKLPEQPHAFGGDDRIRNAVPL